MADMTQANPDIRENEGGVVEFGSCDENTSCSAGLESVDLTRTSTEDFELPTGRRSTFHIYHMDEAHRTISPTLTPSKERYWGPKVRENKAERNARKKLREEGPTPSEVDDGNGAFFLHSPYLAFHAPPRVLYMGNTKYAKPVVLIHENLFWTEYKLQIGPSLAIPGVLDPRGVVAWRHNGGSSQVLKADDRQLKGYKVRTWRLWGESGKQYVHSVKANRNNKNGLDPDVLDEARGEPVKADEVVYLRWMNPLSRQTRSYHFQYVGIDFYWKGTGTVKESRTCGFFVRFCHLKLVAKLPVSNESGENFRDICLGKYTSSVACQKSGRLDLYDAAILRLAKEYAPSVLEQDPFEDQVDSEKRPEEEDAGKLGRMKTSTLYCVIVATAMCMIFGEKQKRETISRILEAGGEGGSGGGGG